MMKLFIQILAFALILGMLQSFNQKKRMTESANQYPKMSYDEATAWADSIVEQMTLEEKIKMIGGDRIFYTNGIERLGIPPVLFADATQGVHLRESFGDITYDEKALPKSVAYPSPIMLTATWNKKLAKDYAKSIGEECKAGGIAVLLGPGMNIYRIAQCGRNFEYFGEDPYLAARMVENYVIGMQSTGTIATLKHFVANNTDYFRRKSNSVVDERTLHEIYMPAFKAGIDAGAMAVMTSYNLVNGEWCGQSKYVIDTLLRQELGFKWLVMTDWWSVFDGVKTIKSGQDLEMPNRIATEDALQLVEEGKVDESDIDRMVSSLLATLYVMDAFDRTKDESLLSFLPEHEEVALQTAREGIVLLRNEKELLPLKSSRNVLLTGEYANKLAEGGGAATVEGYDHILLKEALLNERPENTIYREKATDEEIANADIVVLAIGTYDSEGWDRPFDLPDSTNEHILKVTSLNPNTVVVVNSGSGINMSAWNEKAAAIVYAWYPGQNGAKAIAEVLTGKVNPSGKLPITIEKDFSDSPGANYLPKGAELYSGWNDEQEKKEEIYDVVYDESIFVGYRWYEKKNIEPLYHFGHGLSYTSFKYSDLALSTEKLNQEEDLKVTISVENQGKVAGAEVVQLYVSDVESSVPRPLKELKAFEKIKLEPGEKKTVVLGLDKKAFSYWDPEKKDWKVESGEFEILVGASSTRIFLRETIEIN